jgi:hypothetical protein
MSHFTVIVFGEDVDGQLAPYSEHIQVEPYFRADEGDWILDWGRKEAAKKGIENPTLEQMAEAISSEDEKYEVRDGKIGHMSTYNPKSQWDWYLTGGRWTGYFPMKLGRRCEVGEPGVMTDPARPGYADIARLKDIDIERARNEAAREASAAFDIWKHIYETHGKPESWTSIRDSGIDIDKARELYHAQPAIKAAREARLTFMDCPVERFGFDQVAHVADAMDHALVPFAFVLKGEWFERGKMGLWACVSNEKDKAEWEAFFHKTLRELDPDTLVTLVDCHI